MIILISRAKFLLRCLCSILVVFLFSSWASADDVLKLDANGRQIYEALLDSKPPLEIQNDGTGFGLQFLRASGHPRYASAPGNGSVAEVIYDFKLPEGATELRINFLIYPDSKSASDKLNGSGSPFVFISNLVPGSLGIDFTYKANDTFEKEQKAAVFIKDERATVLFVYQIDRIIIVGKADANFPGLVIRDTGTLSQFIQKEGSALVQHTSLLLGDGKDVLDQREIRALLQ